MKMGRRRGRGGAEVGVAGGEVVVEGMGEEEEEGGAGETRSIIRAILSSSSGQMSGQCVNPK